LLFDGHEAEDGVGELLLVELGLAGAIEVTGGLAEFLVGQVIEGLLNHDIAGAQSVAVQGAGDAGAEREGFGESRTRTPARCR
jgi:hypothetical protein